jgi:hypothetical protein
MAPLCNEYREALKIMVFSKALKNGAIISPREEKQRGKP